MYSTRTGLILSKSIIQCNPFLFASLVSPAIEILPRLHHLRLHDADDTPCHVSYSIQSLFTMSEIYQQPLLQYQSLVSLQHMPCPVKPSSPYLRRNLIHPTHLQQHLIRPVRADSKSSIKHRPHTKFIFPFRQWSHVIRK